MHTLEYEALKTTPVVVLQGTGRNGRERVGGAESSRVREGGGEADPRDATSKPGHSGEDHVPAGVASCLSPYIGPPSRTDVKFHYRHGISANSEEKVDQVRFIPPSTTTLHPLQGDAQGSARLDNNGESLQHTQLVHNVGCIESRVGDTEGYGPTFAQSEGWNPAPGGQEGTGGRGCPYARSGAENLEIAPGVTEEVRRMSRVG